MRREEKVMFKVEEEWMLVNESAERRVNDRTKINNSSFRLLL